MKLFFKQIKSYETDPVIWKSPANAIVYTGYLSGEGAVLTTVNDTYVVPGGAVIDSDGKVLTFNTKTKKFDGEPYGITPYSVNLSRIGGELQGTPVDRIVEGDLIGAALYYGLENDEPVEYSVDIYDALKEALPRIYLDRPEYTPGE